LEILRKQTHALSLHFNTLPQKFVYVLLI